MLSGVFYPVPNPIDQYDHHQGNDDPFLADDLFCFSVKQPQIIAVGNRIMHPNHWNKCQKNDGEISKRIPPKCFKKMTTQNRQCRSGGAATRTRKTKPLHRRTLQMQLISDHGGLLNDQVVEQPRIRQQQQA
jgi:hypothetical protein